MATLDEIGSQVPDETGRTVAPPPLLDGQRLDQPTFHRLYEQHPEIHKAELIDGTVSLTMNVKASHGRADASMQGLLYWYSVETPGTTALANSTTILGHQSEVQPDSALLIDPECGGRTRIDPGNYMLDAPELVVEISDTTLRLDLNAKKLIYEEAGALEYLVYDIPNRKFHRFALRDGKFEVAGGDPDGIHRSRAFPGLWFDESAFLRSDGRALMDSLRQGLESPEHATFVARLARNRANRP